MNKRTLYKYEMFFAALLIQLLYPFFALLFFIPEGTTKIISISILTIASFNLAMKKIPKWIILIFGSVRLLADWGSFLYDPNVAQYLRIYATCIFYLTLVYVLTRNFLIADKINLQVVIGAMSGYLLIGLLGAGTIEMMDFHHHGSFKLPDTDSYNYYYFSFISMVTVGYGDIVPVSSAAKSLIIFISVTGQFYMAIGIASIVAKLINK